MKRNERNNYNHIARDIRKNGIESIINIEVPTNYTHEARQAFHELLTAYNLRAVCIYWNDIKKTWALHYEPARYPEAHDEKRRQEAEDVDTVTARMTRRNWTWNGYPAPAAEAEQPTETENAPQAATQAAELDTLKAIRDDITTDPNPDTIRAALDAIRQHDPETEITEDDSPRAIKSELQHIINGIGLDAYMEQARAHRAPWPADTDTDTTTNNEEEAETMTTTEREDLERINARQNAANLFTNIGPADIAAELAAMEAEQAAPAADPDAATLAPADAACVWDEDGNTITPEDITTDEKKEEVTPMSNTATKPTATPEAAAILAINPAIFKGLHIKLGFDFQQPVTIRRIPAPFTIKKAWKLAGADHDPATSTAAIIMRDTGNTWGIYRDLHMTPITADNLRDDYDDHMSYSLGRAHGYKTVFSSFYAKGIFHDLRKAPTCEAWIIAQRNDLLKPWTEPARDWTERQRDMTPGEHKQHRTYYNNAPAAILIDKSNYRIDNRRLDLKRRAAKLRADRQKAAADDATRATATRRYNDLLKAFNDAKQRIITALVNVDPLTLSPATVDELETIGKAIGEYAYKGLSGAARDINQFEAAARDNKFTTPARYDAAYNEILEKLAVILPADAGTAKEAV